MQTHQNQPLWRLENITLPLNHDEQALTEAICKKTGVKEGDLKSYDIVRRGIDARNNNRINLIYSIDVMFKDDMCKNNQALRPSPDREYKFVAKAPSSLRERPIIIGMGPCGLFAGLVLAQMGFKPIILERGKIVRERTKDTFALWRQHKLNPNSNVQFGEGGAGTFSDGKLHSLVSISEQHRRKILTEFVKAGAPSEILFVSKPHIGTLRLVSMVEKMRASILQAGGEIRFETKVSSLNLDKRQVVGVTLEDGSSIDSRYVIMAIGHSARDTFVSLHEQGVYLQAKPFSIGFRIEHPQGMIDRCRFGNNQGHPLLGAADYKLVHHSSNGRSVYSFCMCPGGTVVAATSEVGHVVTNGMSQYSRVERNANSGIVVGITPQDFPGGPLAGIDLQRRLEKNAFELGGKNYCAPAQLVGDFLSKQPSTALGSVIPSYKPGINLGDLSEALPSYAIEALREALPAFDKKIKGYAMHDAVMTGVETRTSSPLCIKRNEEMQSINTSGLYPAGEGAGYAGGILSAGVDGLSIGEKVALHMLKV